MQLVSVILIHWIVIYPMESAIRHLNNRGQEAPILLFLNVSFCGGAESGVEQTKCIAGN